MSWYSEVRNKLAHLRGRHRFDTSLDEEIRSHLEMRADELVAGGMSYEDALLKARREFGPAARIAEDSREAWRWTWFEDLSRDLRYSARALLRDRRFGLTAIVSLALGIGVNTTIFSLGTSFLLSEPSARDAASWVKVQLGGRGQLEMREYRFVQDAGVFRAVVGLDENAEMNWRSGDANRRLFGIRVTDNFFNEVQPPLAMGRPIQPGDGAVVLVSDRFWRSHLDRDPNVLTRVMVLDGEPHNVIGVLPANHRTLVGLGFAPEIYVPVRKETARVTLHGRIPAGATIEDMRQRVMAVCAQLDQVYPQPHMKWTRSILMSGVSGVERLFGSNRAYRAAAQFFLMLIVIAGLLLAIACTNVASLLLARAAGRTREFAVRLSIGASRSRIVRQLLAESLLLSVLGAAAGLGISWTLARSLNGMLLPLPVPIRLAMEPDWRLLAYAAVIAIVSAALAGLVPALTSTRANANATLKQDEHQVGGAGAKLRKTLVAAQLAVSVIVLVTAALFVRNLLRSTTMHPGFDIRNTTWAHMRLVPEKYQTAPQTFLLLRNVLDRLRSLPGVESATFTNVVPLNDASNNVTPVSSDVRTEPVSVHYQTFSVAEDFFKTLGIAILAGREFTESDREGGPKVVILNETLARMMFGNESAIGHIIQFGDSQRSTVVGVAANSKYVTLGEDERAAIYEPYLQREGNRSNLSFLVRTQGAPAGFTHAINQALSSLDPSAAIEVKPMHQAMGMALLPSRAGAGLLGAIGVLGLTLASIGLFGVLSYSVSRRSREIGLRMALGAQPGDIIRLVAAEGVWMVGSGLGIGMLAAAFVTKPLALFLVSGLTPSDPVTYIVVGGVLVAVGAFAILKPARRALKADPALTLRFE